MTFDFVKIQGSRINDIIAKALGIRNLESDFTPIKIQKFGDFTTNAAFITAKALKKSPLDIATQLKPVFESELEGFAKFETAGAGFINLTLQNKAWVEFLEDLQNTGDQYGSNKMGQNKKVNLEYCSANPTGPIHLGHTRGAIYGDIVSRILAFCGYLVHQEYFINDCGGQIEILIKSAFARYKEHLGQNLPSIEGFYPGLYLMETAEIIFQKFGRTLETSEFAPQIFKQIKPLVIDHMMELIKKDLALLGIKFDQFVSETELIEAGYLGKVNALFESKNLLYRGFLEKPKGGGDVSDEDYAPQERLIFKASEFGDDCDRSMERSGKEPTYFAKDSAYHLHKIERGYDWLILEVGVDHIGYRKRLEAIVKAISEGVKFSFEFHHLVYLKENGEQLKMSKRSGRSTDTSQLLEKVGLGALRFYLVSKNHSTELEFDINKTQELSKENPYHYIQYAHARCTSILKKSAENYADLKLTETDILSIEISEDEKELLKQLMIWPRVVEESCKNLEPHQVNFYLQELASIIHRIWNLGNNDGNLRFILQNNIPQTKFRLNLVKASRLTLGIALGILGIEAVESM